MTGVPFPSDPLRLLAEDRFLRGLARGLLRDAQAADDVVQDAWLAAMARPPRAAGALRAWLRTVVRNLVANRRSAETARQRREAAAARPEAVPSEDEVRAREALRREVVDHVLALPEPYRGAVLLRWFGDLPPRAIAARLGVPSTTVRTRLHRALEMLRARLDQTRDGDRRAWCLALIPLARPQLAGAAAVVGGGALFVGSMVMQKSFVGVLVAMLLLCGAGIVLVLELGGAPGAATTQAAPVAVNGSTAPSAPAAGADRSPRRSEVASTEAADVLAPRTGQLVFADGQPAADVPWWFEPGRRLPPKEGFLAEGKPHAAMRVHPKPGDARRTAADGRFSLPVLAAESRPASGALWCEPATGARVGFLIELSASASGESTVLRLPEFADFEVTCVGAGPEDRWECMAYPAVLEEDGEWNFGNHLACRLDPSDQRVLELDFYQRKPMGPAPVVVRVPAGVPYYLSVQGEAFESSTPGAVHRAPAQVRFEASTRRFWFTLPVEVLEPDGRTPTTQGGRVLISPHDPAIMVSSDYPLVGGRASLDWCQWPEGMLCDLCVLMADGELFAGTVQARAPGVQPARRFVRGQGAPPLRVQFPGSPASLVNATVVMEASDGKLARLARGEEFHLLPGQSGTFVLGPQELGLVAVAPDWRRLWLLLPDGQMGEARNDGRLPGLGSWTATQPLGEFDLAAAFRARKAVRAAAVFELELVTSSGARSWQLVESLELAADDEVAAVPLWRKRVPAGLRGRVRLVSMSGSFDETLTPVR